MFRAFVNGEGTITVESVPADHQVKLGESLFPDAPSAAELAAAFPEAVLRAEKARARATISFQAEAARRQFATDGALKAMAYQEKAREAVAYLAAVASGQVPNSADYLLLQAEVGVTAETLASVAAVVNAKYQGFRQIEASIGGMEAAAQKAVKNAEDGAAIDAVLDALTWPQPEA